MSESARPQPHGGDGGRLPTQTWRPEKRRAFLGRFAPAFYDEANPHQVYGHDRPNAVLENAVGLMLCYDELWFLSRDLCPADMQELDFVRFVSDNAELSKTAREAFRARQEDLRREYAEWSDDTRRPHLREAAIAGDIGRFSDWEASRNRQGHAQYRGQSQRHRYLRDHLTAAMNRAGHTTSLRPRIDYDAIAQHAQAPGDQLSTAAQTLLKSRELADLDQIAEWSVTDALHLGPMDCIVNTGSAILLSPPQDDPDDDVQFETHKIEAIEKILHLRSTDTLTPRGAYDDYIADLRKDQRVKDLRLFLAGRPSPDGSAATLAVEVERIIEAHQREGFRRMHRPAKLRAVASMALGAANQLLPGLGTVLRAMVNADRNIADFKFRRESRWAAFVVDARSRQSPGQEDRI
ncbi:hypothetical protein GCM10010306_099660 [Streptomyces umbrinus]|uniref:hypothetical protein n=1 Tax=Streptomyces umbrinus TaxID=67370 RepID=UPI0016735884|nr:hypothetical protein [Streptomyces umbrinus]GHB88630.1 hypothetical protein GCM10010306_099660 [Streptomyces umbrinus]